VLGQRGEENAAKHSTDGKEISNQIATEKLMGKTFI
jgi:hypothetical protein